MRFTRLNRPPSFCALLAGIYTVLQPFFLVAFHSLRLPGCAKPHNDNSRQYRRASRFAAGFVASWVSLGLLNRPDKVPATKKGDIYNGDDHKLLVEITQGFMGKTLNLSTTISIRAIETIIRNCWTTYMCREHERASTRLKTHTEALVSNIADAGVFVVSTSLVMWSFFYRPQKLSRTYSQWIQAAAQVDPRLITVLRLAHEGEFVYGRNTGKAPILQSMCHDYGWPLEWGR